MVYNLKNNYKMIKKIYLIISLILFFTNISYSQEILKKDGIFVSKIFVGSTFNEIIEESKKIFKKNKVFKPSASRKESKESFIICSVLR